VIVTRGKEDVSIKVADRGGGMPRSVTNRIWTFAKSTLSKKNTTTHSEDHSPGDASEDQMAEGHLRGFGLPLTRIYARYFGGEVTIRSMEGYGVDAYLYMPVLGLACENLPPQVVQSPGNLDSSAEDDDDNASDTVVTGAEDEAKQITREANFFEDSEVRAPNPDQVLPRSTATLDALDERAV